MTNEILKDEMLSAEKLNEVSGGSEGAVLGDAALLCYLCRCGLFDSSEASWRTQGWRVTKRMGDDNNTYQYWDKSKSDWQKMPRWYALGDLLAKANYWGFDKSKKGDGGYVTSFIRSHFSNGVLGDMACIDAK